MGHCVQSTTAKSSCQACGGRAEKMHQPVFVRGTFCPKCCPVCGVKAAQVAAIQTSQAKPRGVVLKRAPAPAQANGGSQWKSMGWGHSPDDPWTHDRDRHAATKRWVPLRKWFSRAS